MHMHIHETGKNSGAMQVHTGGIRAVLRASSVGNRKNTALRNSDIRQTEAALLPNHGVSQNMLHHSYLPRSQPEINGKIFIFFIIQERTPAVNKEIHANICGNRMKFFLLFPKGCGIIFQHSTQLRMQGRCRP